MTGGRVVVAMSGGVDSAVTAALLKEQGYQVIGMTLHLDGGTIDSNGARPCCGGRDVADARRVAERIGIPHYVLDHRQSFFNDVIVPFAESYGRGETPVPCILCNRTVKFRDLLAAARLLEAEGLATGHYVCRREGPDGPELWRSRDRVRDQSYFLFATTRDQLGFLRFPLGELTDKEETRAHARRLGLPVAEKPDSQDICFVPDGDYGQIVQTVRPEMVKPGDIMHMDGRILGQHRGVVHYTIGQRRGLGIGGAHEPLYVVHLEPATQRVIVGPHAALLRDCFALREVNWLGESEAPPATGRAVTVRLRSMHNPLPAMLYGHPDGAAHVRLSAPFAGIAPGQACVFYQGDRLLGGGWIHRPQDS